MWRLRSILGSRFRLLGEKRSVAFIPFLCPTIYFRVSITVFFLYDTKKLSVVALRFQKILIRQPTPFVLNLAFKLFLVHNNVPPSALRDRKAFGPGPT